jgi:hypothetical protein
VIEAGEDCDLTALGGETCLTVEGGFTGGTLACTATCTFNTAACTDTVCGNGTVETGEECDDATANSNTTPDACRTDCTLPSCGDGVIDVQAGEECDPPGAECSATCMTIASGCGDDPNEPNDTEATATVLTLGAAPLAGATCGDSEANETTDPDWFTFTQGASDPNSVRITVAWSAASTDLDVTVTDCAGTAIANGYSGDPTGEVVVVEGQGPGTFCVSVDWYMGPTTDLAYTIKVEGITSCLFDEDCDSGYCPLIGANAGYCTETAPTAGCGDTIPGSNDTSSQAVTLVSGTPVTEGTCDGPGAAGEVDVDFFQIALDDGDALSVVMNQDGSLTPGDVDFIIFDTDGVFWGGAQTTSNPETFDGTYFPAGIYYIVTYYYDNDGATPATDTYTLTATVTATGGCQDDDDCAAMPGHGRCDVPTGACRAFDGAGAQTAGEFCDSNDDCATGSTVFDAPNCITADPTLGSDNVCTMDCTQDSDCASFNGMVCHIVQAPNGLCWMPCTSDEGCMGGTCTIATGHCGGF